MLGAFVRTFLSVNAFLYVSLLNFGTETVFAAHDEIKLDFLQEQAPEAPFEVEVEKTLAEKRLGVRIDADKFPNKLFVSGMQQEGLVPQYNSRVPKTEQVRYGCTIVSVNGIKGDKAQMKDAMRKEQTLRLLVDPPQATNSSEGVQVKACTYRGLPPEMEDPSRECNNCSCKTGCLADCYYKDARIWRRCKWTYGVCRPARPRKSFPNIVTTTAPTAVAHAESLKVSNKTEARPSNDAHGGALTHAKVILLVTSLADPNVDSSQRWLENMFMGRGVREENLEKVDGALHWNYPLRDELFEISGMTGDYPQVFIKDAGGITMFVGDFSDVDEMNENMDLPPEILEANPDIPNFRKTFESVIG